MHEIVASRRPTCTFTASTRTGPASGFCAASARRSVSSSRARSTAAPGSGGWISSRSPTTTASAARWKSPICPGTFLSAEVTTYFPENGCKVHVLVLGIDEAAVPHDPGVAGRHLPVAAVSGGGADPLLGVASVVSRQRPADDRPGGEADPDVPAVRGDQRGPRPAQRRNWSARSSAI